MSLVMEVESGFLEVKVFTCTIDRTRTHSSKVALQERSAQLFVSFICNFTVFEVVLLLFLCCMESALLNV